MATSAAVPTPAPVELTAEHYPPPQLGRWSRVWRYALASFVVVIQLISDILMSSADSPAWPRWRVPLDLAFGVAGLLVVRWRRRWPLLMTLGLLVVSIPFPSVATVAIWSYVSMATRRRWREVLIAGPAMWISAMASGLLDPVGPGVTVTGPAAAEPNAPTEFVLMVSMAVVFLITMLSLTAWGFYLGARRDLIASLRARADEAERAQEARLAQGQAMERARIAREMHDVLAHRISLVAMHAGALAYRTDLSPEQTREAAQVIQDNAHQSLTELRGVLGSLRSESSAPEAPQPTLRDVPALVAEAREGGQWIDATFELIEAETISATIGRHAYRIVQEALTNARKHAPGGLTVLRVVGSPVAGLTIEVRNPLVRSGSSVPGAQLGLVGLGERVGVTGGRIEHGPTPTGEFVVRVWLPWKT